MADDLSRRVFLTAGVVGAAALVARANAPIDGKLLPDKPEPVKVPNPDTRRVGFAVVGLGRLSINQILPAIPMTDHCKLAALVTGHPDEKGKPLAEKYGLDPKNIYTYDNYDDMKNNPDIEVVYIVLPNAMHPEYTIRAAKAGKHVLCEKPMANSSADCQRMVDACKAANKQLMVAYRLQYEPLTLMVQKLIAAKALGKIKVVNATNCQNEHPGSWRTDKSLSGFGGLSDIGIYCLNTTRFILGEDPVEVSAYTYSTPNDSRWNPADGCPESYTWTMRFPSGAIMNATCSYGCNVKFYALGGEEGSAFVSKAYGYHGQKLEFAARANPEKGIPGGTTEASVNEIDHFAREMDELAMCIKENRPVKANGEEGVKDLRYIEAIDKAAREGGTIKLT
ncbi:MAG: Gfo/Idh/MocA family protein [Phycisphaerae bacterium]